VLGVGDGSVFDVLQRPGWEGFVFDVQAGEFPSCGGEGVEVRGERDAGEFALEVGGVAFAVFGVELLLDFCREVVGGVLGFPPSAGEPVFVLEGAVGDDAFAARVGG
jgi:hypothetical protein